MELSQEFHFASCETKVQLNEIYNSHYYGSPLWNLCGRAVKSFESSYNRAIKVIYDLPLLTHRSLIEPISGLQLVFMHRFLGFIKKVEESVKTEITISSNQA